MTSGPPEKERRLDAHERERAVAQRRHGLRRAVVAVAVGAVVVATPLAVVLGSDGGGTKRVPATDAAAAGGPFGQHYAGLVQRREAAHVPTMMDTMYSRVHFHPLLKVYVSGKQIPVPANIGIDPTQDAMQMAGLHTHDASGTIHVEGVEGARLGQFFRIWGVPLSANRLGPYRAGPSDAVRMWLDGKPSTAFGRLKLADQQRIVVDFGAKNAPPPAA